MKTLLFVNIFLTFYLANARIAIPIENNIEPRLGFESLERFDKKSDVNKDIQDIINLLPRGDIEGVVNKWVASDEECKKDWNFITSDSVHTLISDIEKSGEFLAIRQQLEGAHVDVVRFANMVHEIIKMQPMSRSSTADAGGLRGALDEIRSILPMTKIKLKIAQKLLLSSQFRGLLALLTNAQFKQNMVNLTNSPKILEILDQANQNGVDIQAIKDFLKSLLKLVDIDYA